LANSIPPVTTRRVEIAPKTMLWLVVAVGACWLLVKLAPVVLTVVVAMFLVGTLGPAVDWLEGRGWRRSRAVVSVFVALFLVAVLLGALTLPSLVEQARNLAQHEPELRNRIADWLAQARPTAKLAQTLRHLQYGPLIDKAVGPALSASARAAAFVAYLLSAIFLALYIMIDRDRLRGGLYAVVPRGYHVRLSRVLLHLETIVGGYIRGQALTSALMSLFTFGLLFACGVDNAMALAVFAGLADVLPYIGCALAVAPAAAAASSHGVVTTLIVAAALLAYQEFESRVLIPRIYGRTLRLPSSMVLVALLAGGTLGGIIGALLALPVAAAIRMFVEQLHVDLPGESVDYGPLRERDDLAEQEYAIRAVGMPIQQAAAIAVEISEDRSADDEP
jgi:predicted PurR-regulated permease PerM